MKKFYHKKEVSLEETPILLRLERRHTLMAGGQDSGKDRRASRANSVGSTTSMSTPVEQFETPPTHQCLSDGKRSILSRTSTVVITESELSSSWLYNNKKAQIDAIDETAVDSKSDLASNSLDNLIPETHQEPQLKPAVTSARRKRETTCCCYMTIALFICLASIGILTAIGGIIYMELFTAYVEKSNSSTSTHSQELLGNRIVNSSTQEAYDESERLLDDTLLDEQTPIGFPVSGIGMPGKIGFKTVLKSDGEHLSDKELNSSVNIQNENQFIQETHSSESNSNFNEEDSSKSGHQSMEDLPGNSINKGSPKEVELSDHDKLDLFMKYNDQMKKYFLINESQIPRELPKSETELVQGGNDFVQQEFDYNLENSSYSDIDALPTEWSDAKTAVPLDSNSDILPIYPGHLAYLPFDEIKNIGGIKENMPNAEFDDQNENSHRLMNVRTDLLPINVHNEGLESGAVEKGPGTIDLNETRSQDSASKQQVQKNPSDEQKSVPFEFFRRLGFNQESIIAHPALTVEDMNVKFSLAEALKYLRSLDANNKLPTSRKKSVASPNTRKSSKEMNDNGKERKEYLTKLRRNMYN